MVRAWQMTSVAFAAVMALLKALATVTETSKTSVAFAAVMALQKALATVTETSSTLVAFVPATAALALVRMSL